MKTAAQAAKELAANVVKPGGLLVYSTCSLEPEENDQPVDLFLATHPQFKIAGRFASKFDEKSGAEAFSMERLRSFSPGRFMPRSP